MGSPLGGDVCPRQQKCYKCLNQQYLLGVHERCHLDGSLMKSLCAPGLSCMIYCSEASKFHNISILFSQKKLTLCDNNKSFIIR